MTRLFGGETNRDWPIRSISTATLITRQSRITNELSSIELRWFTIQSAISVIATDGFHAGADFNSDAPPNGESLKFYWTDFVMDELRG